MLSIIKSF